MATEQSPASGSTPPSFDVLLDSTRRARARSLFATTILALLALTALRYAFDLPPNNPLVGFWIEIFAGISTFAAAPFVLESFAKRRTRTMLISLSVGFISLTLYFFATGAVQSILLELAVSAFLLMALDFAVTSYLLPAIDATLDRQLR